MPHHDSGDDVLVSPRYLAGTRTDPVAPLLEAAPGWGHALVGSDPYYASPGQHLRTARREGECTFTYAADPLGMPVWSAHFDRAVPDEVRAAFAELLLDGVETYFADYLRGGPQYTGQTPAHVFAAHEWEPAHGSRPWRMVAPDGHAAFHIRSGYLDEQRELRERGMATWRLTAGPDPVSRPTWTASFTAHTPEPLVTATAVATVNPEPARRPAHQVPELHRPLVSLQPAEDSARAAAAQIRSHAATATPLTPDHAHSPGPTPTAPRPTRKH